VARVPEDAGEFRGVRGLVQNVAAEDVRQRGRRQVRREDQEDEQAFWAFAAPMCGAELLVEAENRVAACELAEILRVAGEPSGDL